MASNGIPQVMPLGPQHEGELVRLLLGLDTASRISRFNCAASDAYLLEHLQRALTTATWIAGIFIERRLRGLVEVYDLEPAGTVEAAFLVEQSCRCRGFGTALLHAATTWATESDRTMLRMLFSRRNRPMRKLASNAEARLDLVSDEVLADITIAPLVGLGVTLLVS